MNTNRCCKTCLWWDLENAEDAQVLGLFAKAFWSRCLWEEKGPAPFWHDIRTGGLQTSHWHGADCKSYTKRPSSPEDKPSENGVDWDAFEVEQKDIDRKNLSMLETSCRELIFLIEERRPLTKTEAMVVQEAKDLLASL